MARKRHAPGHRTGAAIALRCVPASWRVALAPVACSPGPGTVERVQRPTPAPPAVVPDVTADALGGDPEPVQPLIGSIAMAELQPRAGANAGADSLRLLAAGQSASTEYRAGRFNLQLDADGRVSRAYRG